MRALRLRAGNVVRLALPDGSHRYARLARVWRDRAGFITRVRTADLSGPRDYRVRTIAGTALWPTLVVTEVTRA